MTTSCSSVARRSTRSSGRRSGPMPTVVMPEWPPRPRAGSSTSAAPVRPDGVPTQVPTEVPTRLVIVGCGALARELLAITAGIPGIRVEGVDARLHMRPQLIADAVAAKVDKVRERYGSDVGIFVAYADCGTGGTLDAYLEREGLARIGRAHRYELYAGPAVYEAMQGQEG